MKSKNLFLLIVSIVLLIANTPFTGAVTLKIDPSQKVLPAVGSTFNISVKIEDASDLGGFEFDLSYPTSIVTIENDSDVSLGDFLGSTGRSTSTLGPEIDNTAGTLTFGGFSYGDEEGASGSGDLATITFTVESRQDGTLDLQNATVTDTEASEIVVDSLVDGSLKRQSILVSPDPVYRSRWVALPKLMRIEGAYTNFDKTTKVEYDPTDSALSVIKMPRLVLPAKQEIWQIIIVMPSLLTGVGFDGSSETVTVTVSTGTEEVVGTFEIDMLTWILDE